MPTCQHAILNGSDNFQNGLFEFTAKFLKYVFGDVFTAKTEGKATGQSYHYHYSGKENPDKILCDTQLVENNQNSKENYYPFCKNRQCICRGCAHCLYSVSDKIISKIRSQ